MLLKTKLKKIKIIIFNDLKQLITFLKYFFKLRPSYKTKVTEIFRLVIENSVMTKWNGPNCRTRESEILLKWLNNVGTRVPALIFHQERISIDKIVQMIKLYDMLFISKEIEDLENFTLMKNISNFYHL